jgi:LysR family hydrogen peroxide-inducible transcriptional activator
LEHARRVLGAVDDLVTAAQDHLDPLAGTLKLGLIPTLAPYLLPHLLPGMREALPRLNPTIVEEQTAILVEHLRAGSIDAAMLATQPDDDRFEALTLFDEPLWLAVPASHPFAGRTRVEPSEIDPSTLLLLAEGHCLRDQALAFCAEPSLGAGISGDFRAASLETIVHLVEAGLGITFVPELYLRNLHAAERAGVVLRPLASPTATRRIQMVFRRSTPRNGVLREVARITRTVWSQISDAPELVRPSS